MNKWSLWSHSKAAQCKRKLWTDIPQRQKGICSTAYSAGQYLYTGLPWIKDALFSKHFMQMFRPVIHQGLHYAAVTAFFYSHNYDLHWANRRFICDHHLRLLQSSRHHTEQSCGWHLWWEHVTGDVTYQLWISRPLSAFQTTCLGLGCPNFRRWWLHSWTLGQQRGDIVGKLMSATWHSLLKMAHCKWMFCTYYWL